MAHIQQQWPNWVDPIGQEYKVGDTVAVAVGGSSPEQVIGLVRRINKTTQDGQQIIGGWGKNAQPSCSVTIEVHTRGGRWSSHVGKLKTQTYNYPNRIVKIRSGEIPPEELKYTIEDLLRIEEELR